jgi:hypothetical protein
MESTMLTEGDAILAVAAFMTGVIIGATGVVGAAGVLLARRASLRGLTMLASWFLAVALMGACALPWIAPGWAVAIAGAGAGLSMLVLWLTLRSRWPQGDESGKEPGKE